MQAAPPIIASHGVLDGLHEMARWLYAGDAGETPESAASRFMAATAAEVTNRRSESPPRVLSLEAMPFSGPPPTFAYVPYDENNEDETHISWASMLGNLLRLLMVLLLLGICLWTLILHTKKLIRALRAQQRAACAPQSSSKEIKSN